MTFIETLIWSVIPGYYRRGIPIPVFTLGCGWFIPSISQRHTSAAQQQISQENADGSSWLRGLNPKRRKRALSKRLRHPAPLDGQHCALALLKLLQVFCRTSARWYQYTKVFIPAVTNFVLAALNDPQSIRKHMTTVETAAGRHGCSEWGIPYL